MNNKSRATQAEKEFVFKSSLEANLIRLNSSFYFISLKMRNSQTSGIFLLEPTKQNNFGLYLAPSLMQMNL